jgi:hypothetical protein
MTQLFDRSQLEGCSREKLRSRALDLRQALGLNEKAAPLPATPSQLIEFILEVRSAVVATHSVPLLVDF